MKDLIKAITTAISAMTKRVDMGDKSNEIPFGEKILLPSNGIKQVVLSCDPDLRISQSTGEIEGKLCLNDTINSSNVHYSSEVKGEVLEIYANVRGTFSGTFELRIPQGLNIKVKGTSGSVFVDSISLCEVIVNTASGDINVRNASFTTCSLESMSGTIVAKLSIDECKIETKSLSGDVVVKEIFNNSSSRTSLSCSTMSGDIVIKKYSK